ncbi:hypothetical protein SK128_028120 [Halocaridina rubra]|uniref:Nucleotidyl transferase domain-containing protein n=1 Tax=Halocaridina rubra TaxID=373956 RepID=A0AAN8XD73_HALRR
MRVVILAAGFGTRLEKDLQNDTSGAYVHLLGVPKPLLPIGDKPLITHWIQMLKNVPDIASIVIVVNELHRDLYVEWAKTLPLEVVIVSSGARANEERPGAVACMEIGVQEKSVDTFFVAGDTLLMQDFNIQAMIIRFKSLQREHEGACLIVSAPVAEENVSKHGIIEVSESGRVTGFIEKPLPTETKSRLQCPCIYMISGTSLHHLKNFLVEKKDEPLQSRDATGLFIAELIHVAPVYGYQVKGRFDVGGLESYIQCHESFEKN